MKIKCLHGYFEFIEERVGEVSDLMSVFALEITSKGGKYIFKDIVSAPTYSIKGAPYLGTTAIVTFEGEPWEVLEANGLVYDFTTGLVVPITSITLSITLEASGKYFSSPGLILPGSLTDDGARVKDYSGWYSFETLRFRYSEVGFV